ncbi:MAG: hypothetical protein WCR27_03680 [Eubacteriales bacterium]
MRKTNTQKNRMFLLSNVPWMASNGLTKAYQGGLAYSFSGKYLANVACINKG